MLLWRLIENVDVTDSTQYLLPLFSHVRPLACPSSKCCDIQLTRSRQPQFPTNVDTVIR
jgi:hypothetical protein